MIPAEESTDCFLVPPQSGSPQLWSKAIMECNSSGHAKLTLLENGDQALGARISLIRSAKRSLRIQTFNWKSDESGRLVFWELLRAVKQRGVKVEILIDQMFCGQNPEMIAFLATFDPLLKLKLYNPCFNQLAPSTVEQLAELASDFHTFNARLHNKLFVADDQIVITGGRNFSNLYFDRNIGLNYKDRDILAILPNPSPVLQCLKEYWDSNHSVNAMDLEDVAGLVARKSFPILACRKDFELNNLFPELYVQSSDADYVAKEFLDDMLEVSSLNWVFDRADKAEIAPVSQSRVATELSKIVASAKKEVIIQSPYVVLSDQAVNLFKQLKKQNPEVRVLVSTNSLAATDSWTTYAANYKEKRLYLEELGFEMWEFKPIPEDIHEMMRYRKLLARLPTEEEVRLRRTSPFQIDQNLPAFPYEIDSNGSITHRTDRRNDHLRSPPFLSMHAKSMVIDGEIAFVGSFNLDPRSVEYNTEIGLIVEDKKFAELLRSKILRDASPRNSYRIAAKEEFPLISQGNRLLNFISEGLPLLDPWPFRITSSFRLRKGMAPVKPVHNSFHQNWEDVGNFPQVGFFARKHIAARLFKSTAMILKPLL